MKIIKMLPFLDEAEKKELVDAIINDELEDGSVSPAMLIPFLSGEDTDRLFHAALEGKISTNPTMFLPFLEEEQMSKLVQEIKDGVITTLSLEDLMPFLGENEIHELFKHAFESIKKKKAE